MPGGGQWFFGIGLANLDEVLDEIGCVFPYSRADVLAMPATAILRLYKRAMLHLKFAYSAVRLVS